MKLFKNGYEGSAKNPYIYKNESFNTMLYTLKTKAVLPLLLTMVATTACNPTPTTPEKMEVKEVKTFKAQVGEGPIWDYKYNRLLWIDTQGSVYIYETGFMKKQKEGGKGETEVPYTVEREIKVGKMVGTMVPYTKDTVIVGLQDGIYKLDLKTERLTFMAAPEGGIEGNKYNDGKCDASGRLWIGTMDNNCAPKKANFFVYDGTDSRKVLDSVTISNGVAWSPDGTKMYYQDTPTRCVSQFDFDEEKGEISNRKEVIQLPEELGTPDGNTIDEEGMLWVANWGAACVTRWNPNTGELLQKISVPALNVTAVAFGGENLDELYITTAALWMPEGEEKNYPNAGKLFVVKPGVKGRKCNYFKNGK
ncbi:MAG: SMP-30/gluconolactonase/LRE family protein [Paludibacteraceae bacterium]|nr:SMP-30/gluconolactonase/LRE family protein [Paludibacteraceae bacterium]